MVDAREHRKIVLDVARVFNLSDQATTWAMIGAEVPDIDLYVGKHRKTLHNPALGMLTSVIPADDEGKVGFLLGLATHLFLDRLSKHAKAVQRMFALIEKVAEA